MGEGVSKLNPLNRSSREGGYEVLGELWYGMLGCPIMALSMSSRGRVSSGGFPAKIADVR